MNDFELVEDVEGERKLIERMIRMNGNDPEQNCGYFLSHEEEEDKCVLIKNGKYGILTTYDKTSHNWVMIGAPIAPKDKQVGLLNDALSYLDQKGKMDKFVAEFETERKKQSDVVLNKKFRLYSPSCVLYWPVYDMKTWTGDKLKGKEWKKIRNIVNNVKKRHRVRIVDSRRVKKEKLKQVIKQWAKWRNQTGFGINRKDSNRTDYDHYMKLVDLDFTGCEFAKTILFDGKPVSITAGWSIPNTDREYYSGIGVCDLSIPNLGVFSNWSDLMMLKKAGYNKVDFGGSPKPLLQFKKKFKPEKIYRTYIFTIGKKS